ncbi:MAG: hypothetical protein ACP5T2_02310 [Thermoprotei archaeon]
MLIILFLASQEGLALASSTPEPNVFSSLKAVSISFQAIKLNHGDYVALFVAPPVYDMGANVTPYNITSTYDLHIIAEYPQYLNSSLVVMIPGGPGTYNLSVTFISKGPFMLQYGIVTQNYTAYTHLAATPVPLASGIWFLPIFTENYGANYTAYRFTSTVIELGDSKVTSSLFSFKFPSIVSVAVFLVFLLFISYIDAFALADTYWKSKAQEGSKKRWAGVILLLILTVLVAYWSMGLLGVRIT